MTQATADNPLQFQIRHLLGVMVAIAVASAVLAPWIRDLTRGQWLRLGFTVSLAAGTFGTMLVLHGSLFLRRRRRLGTVHYELRGAWCGQPAWCRFMPYFPLVLAAFFAIALTWLELSTPSHRPYYTFRLIGAFNLGMCAAQGVAFLLFPMDRVLLGENGLMASNYFFSWADVWYSWDRGAKSTPIFLMTSSMARYCLDVTPGSEEAVAGFLQTRTRLRENRPRRM